MIQYSRAVALESTSRGVLDTPLSRGMTLKRVSPSSSGNSSKFGYAGVVKLGFEESQSSYSSGSQSARAWTEAWVSAWAYCPHCGNTRIAAFPNNSPLADFFCTSCSEEFELKSQKGKFGTRVVDGAFKTKCERLAPTNNPHLFLLYYNLKTLGGGHL